MEKINWGKKVIYLFIVVIFGMVSFFLGYFYNDYQLRLKDVTSKVEITCNVGNEQTFNAKDTNLKFTQKDFDANGDFIAHDKNSAIQEVCGISTNEMNEIIERIRQGEDAPLLFSVTLTN